MKRTVAVVGASAALPLLHWTQIQPNASRPLTTPRAVAGRAATWLDPNEVVYGIAVLGDARAYPQRIVAWHAQTSKHVELVMIPLRMALWERGRQGHPIRPKQLRAHSDAGSQYVSLAYTDKLALDGIAPSIGSVGDAYDNALMETINGLYKAECIRTTVFHDGPYRTLADVEFATAGWVDWFNTRRLHSSLGYATPAEFEQAHYADLNREPQPA